MKQQFKVIHIELREPYNGEKHYYFGSKVAVYDSLPEDVVGIKLESLWNVNLEAGEYSNKLCTIRAGVLRRKETNRGKNHFIGEIPRIGRSYEERRSNGKEK